MRRLHVDQLQRSMVLAQNLYNDRGDLLLARGIPLSDQYVDRIRAHHFVSVEVQDGIADDVVAPEVLSERVRNLTRKHLGEMLSLGQRIATALEAGETNEQEAINTFVASAKPHFHQIYADVGRIVEDAAGSELLCGIIALKSFDNYTIEHSVEVAATSVVLGERLNLHARDLTQLALGGLCHDFGRMIVPDKIMNKPDRLSTSELDLMRRHPQAGYETVQQLTGSNDIVSRQVVRQHHERQDGLGYPKGLRGSNHISPAKQLRGQPLIMLAAEIAAVADVYSAMASDRPFRPAMGPTQIIDALLKMAGTSLNREIVTRFLSVLPVYPVGTEVIVLSGALKDYRGIVTKIETRDIDRPVVRILFDPNAKSVAPFEVDTRKERLVQIEASSWSRALGLSATSLTETVGM